MAISVSLGVRRFCSIAVRLAPRLGLGPHQSQVPGPLLVCYATKPLSLSNTYSRVGFVCQRQLFTKWSSAFQSSVPKEQMNSSSVVAGQKSVTDANKGEEKQTNREEELDEELDEEESIIPKTDENGQPLSNWSRMKIMMKTYGYVIIPVHWVIAPFWFGAFYYTIKMGVDIGPFLTAIGVSDHHVESLRNSSASTVLMAYALYKIFTPLRYTVTLGATEMTIRRLRRMGYIRPHPPKEKTYRDSFKETVSEVRDKLKDR